MRRAALKKSILILIICIITSCAIQKGHQKLDPLPSWNDRDTKSDIITFVDNVSDPASTDYIPPQDRIATFDFDGTIYCEKPIYANFEVCISHYREDVAQDSTLKDVQPYKAAMENDYKYMNSHIIDFLTLDYVGKAEEDYVASVSAFIDTTIHSELQIPYKYLFYIPMVELIEFLLQNDFQVFISSGSMTGFLRGACRENLPVEPWHIVGSRVELEYSNEDSTITFLRKENIVHNNNAEGKVLGIYTHIGKPPIIAVGNTCGDLEMLRYAQDNDLPHLVLVINHDDSKREYEYYDIKLLEFCKQNGWGIVSMSKDFMNIFIR